MATPRPAADVAIPTHARILIVEARFYDDIADALLDGAVHAVVAAGSEYELQRVPGALEIPGAIAILMEAAAAKGRPFDGAVALGTVIRGETTHYDIVAGESSRALMDLTISKKWPIGNGILTVENEAQAWARARRSELDKGGGAAKACLAMIRLKRAAETA